MSQTSTHRDEIPSWLSPQRHPPLSGASRRGFLSLGGAAVLLAPHTAWSQQADLPFETWVAAFRPRAEARGVSRATYQAVMAGMVPDLKGLEADKAQPETVEPVWRYLNRRVSDWRITRGREKVKEYADLFDRIERVYGVDRYHLCALWGMESAFGDVSVDPKWMRPVIPSLAGLAWGDPRRRRYWEAELVNALVIVDRGWARPVEMIGSWAGAMGHTQWMPEVWLNTGVDFNADGRVSPFGPPDDALAGTARYMVERGKYRSGETWGYEVRLPPGFDAALADGRVRQSLAHWAKLGVARIGGEAFPRPTDIAQLALPAGVDGPCFAFLQNLRAIRSYNPSTKYALAIGHLADRIRGGGPFVQPWPTEEVPLTLAESQELQSRLTSLGYDTGGTDGRVGEKTQSALQAWQKATGILPADGFPTQAALKRLRGV